MKKLFLIASLLASFIVNAQQGFNKTYNIISNEASIITDIIKLDSIYFVLGGTIYNNSTSSTIFLTNLLSSGDTINVKVYTDTLLFFYGNAVGNAKLKNNNIFTSFKCVNLNYSPYINETKFLYFNINDTIYTKTVYSDTLENYPTDIIYLNGYYYITGAITFPSSSYADIMLLKTDTLGNLLWMKHFGNDKAIGYQIISTFDHKIMLAAHYYDYLGTNQS